VSHATATHLWSTDGALTSATGSLLLERLATGTGNFATVLGGLGSLASSCQLGNYNLVD
jgi:hypothetical protein